MNERFEKWWQERSKKIPKTDRRSAKRWALIGWEAHIVDDKLEKEEERTAFYKRLQECGEDISNPSFWGDFS